jgi:hypothetical protein
MPIHKLRAVDQKGSYTCLLWTKTNMASLLTKGRGLSVDENGYAHDNDIFQPYVLTISRTVSHADIAKLIRIGPIFMKFEGSLQFSQEPANSRILDQVNLVPLQYHLAAEHWQSLCRSTRCEKAFVSQLSHFYPVPPVVLASKLITNTGLWKFSLTFVLTNLWFFSVKKFATFGNVGISFSRKFN